MDIFSHKTKTAGEKKIFFSAVFQVISCYILF